MHPTGFKHFFLDINPSAAVVPKIVYQFAAVNARKAQLFGHLGTSLLDIMGRGPLIVF